MEEIINDVDVSGCKYYRKNKECDIWGIPCQMKEFCYFKILKQENKELYKENNCLHKIIDRLLENSGYSKDIASAEDFEDVYEDMQIKRNELIELKQALEEIKNFLDVPEFYIYGKEVIHNRIENKINEVLE